MLDTGDILLYIGTTRCRDNVKVLQKRTGQIIGSPEQIAHEEGFISTEQLHPVASLLLKSGYGEYLLR